MLSLIPVSKKFVEKNLQCDPVQAGYVTFSFDFFFYVMASYYILKPMRDLTGVMLGNTSSLFRWTMVAVLLVNPLFSMLMARIPRASLVPVLYRFFISHLLLFFVGFIAVGVGKAELSGSVRLIPSLFFVWVSVFNLFAVSLFWSVMADRFTGAQGRKVFGFIGAGGTLGQMAGSALATKLPALTGVSGLLLISALLLEISVRCRPSLEDVVGQGKAVEAQEKPKPWTGIWLVMRSAYLFGICAYLFLYTFTSSFIYLQKQDLVGAAFASDEAKLQFFAQINFVVSAATLAIQLFFTGRLITSLGLIFSLSLMPGLTSVGFATLALAPGLYLLAAFEAVRTTLNYAISRPSREILFTVVSKEDKYISKNFIDTFVYRAGDSIASFAFDGLKGLNLGTTGISWAAVPFSVLWTGLAMGLGAAQRRRQKHQEAELARLASSGQANPNH
ncbi:MAG: MFS transporter [Candidatus Eremiobacteraeota bacterium]|nr:MFS transporter [Candidatus Eremiobacteraeota bacterium]MCW5871192.1 MFS transporter [Candidatus Eremiobacteraeota bacterium]